MAQRLNFTEPVDEEFQWDFFAFLFRFSIFFFSHIGYESSFDSTTSEINKNEGK